MTSKPMTLGLGAGTEPTVEKKPVIGNWTVIITVIALILGIVSFAVANGF
jgi:uncharacterized integral membrane protein